MKMRTKPRCKDGTPCGNACIESSDVCQVTLAPELVSDLLSMVQPFSATLTNASQLLDLRPVPTLYAGKGAEEKSLKVQQALDSSLTGEARVAAGNGMAAWLSLDYLSLSPLTYMPGQNPQLRRAIKTEDSEKYLSQDETEQAKGLLRGAVLALHHLPPPSYESMLAEHTSKLALKSDKALAKPAPEPDFLQKLNRWITVPDPDQLVKSYTPGSTVTELGMFGTSYLPAKYMGSYANRANVSFKVKAKEGTGGRAVDFAKTSAFEGEILFPPGSKFKVKSVTKEESFTEVAANKGIFIMGKQVMTRSGESIERDIAIARTAEINKSFKGKYSSQAEADAVLQSLNTEGYDVVAIPDKKAKTPGRYVLAQPKTLHIIELEEV